MKVRSYCVMHPHHNAIQDSWIFQSSQNSPKVQLEISVVFYFEPSTHFQYNTHKFPVLHWIMLTSIFIVPINILLPLVFKTNYSIKGYWWLQPSEHTHTPIIRTDIKEKKIYPFTKFTVWIWLWSMSISHSMMSSLMTAYQTRIFNIFY